MPKKHVLITLSLTLIAIAMLCACSGNKGTTTDGQHYYLGADISWATSMEARGLKLYNTQGEERECTALMKELGLDALRFRVWVNPDRMEGKAWNGAEDLLEKCKRAKENGMAIMVDFHYSDTWADPNHQPVPREWSGKPHEEVCKLLAEHTKSVLKLLKDNGIHAAWVQVGNETSNGLLWPPKEDGMAESLGHFPDQSKQYADFIRTGYDAVKEISPETKVIVHLDSGFHQPLFDSNLDSLRRYGVKWDIVGMSVYPHWAIESGLLDDEEQSITDAVANMRHIAEKYGTPVMVVETGFTVDEENPEVLQKGRDRLRRLISESKTLGEIPSSPSENWLPTAAPGELICQGCFYWEPECRPDGYKLGAFGSDGRPTIIMDGFKEN